MGTLQIEIRLLRRSKNRTLSQRRSFPRKWTAINVLLAIGKKIFSHGKIGFKACGGLFCHDQTPRSFFTCCFLAHFFHRLWHAFFRQYDTGCVPNVQNSRRVFQFGTLQTDPLYFVKWFKILLWTLLLTSVETKIFIFYAARRIPSKDCKRGRNFCCCYACDTGGPASEGGNSAVWQHLQDEADLLPRSLSKVNGFASFCLLKLQTIWDL